MLVYIKFCQNKQKSARPSCASRSEAFDETSSSKEETVQLHPASVLFGKKTFQDPFIIFHEKVKTSAVFIRDGTLVKAIPLMLFATEIKVLHLEGIVVVDEWLRLKCAANVAALVSAIRKQLTKLLRKKIEDSTFDLFNSAESSKLLSRLARAFFDKGGGFSLFRIFCKLLFHIFVKEYSMFFIYFYGYFVKNSHACSIFDSLM